MIQSHFRRQLLLALILPTALVLIMALVLGFEIRGLQQALNWVDHSDRVIGEARLAMRSMVDFETGVRGYLLTGRKEFLEPSEAAAPSIEASLEALSNLTADNSAQQKRLALVEVKYRHWRDLAGPMIETTGKPKPADLAAEIEAKARMDAVRDAMRAFVDAEDQLRTERMEHASSLHHRVILVLIVLAFALAATVSVLSRYQLRILAKEYEDALYTAEAKTASEHAQKKWFSTLLSSVGDAVIATDDEGRIAFMNGVAEVATGWKQEEAHRKPLTTVFNIVNEETRELVENPVDKVRRLNSVVGLANHTILIRRDGTEINIDDSGAPIRDESGTMVGVILIFRDITKQYAMERALRTTEKLALAGRITASVAHEIHNPLDTVGNLLYLIASEEDPELEANYIQLAIQELQRVNHVTRSMLSLYRESGAPVAVAVHDVMDSVLSLLDSKIRNKEIEIARSFDGDDVVEGFPAELRQVFTNLVHNAIDAVPVHGRISVSGGSNKPGEITVTVSDNGSGISPDHLPKLFQPLFTTKGQNGTGLGLWVSKGILEKHGGSIEVSTSTIDGESGTTFRVTLPRRFPTQHGSKASTGVS